MQTEYNRLHGITPQTIRKEIQKGLSDELAARKRARQAVCLDESEFDRTEQIVDLERDMFEAAEKLDFERAALLRDRIRQLKEMPELNDVSETSGNVPTERRNKNAKSKRTRKR
jgi:excinuclease ABC subunit B